jgi:hypothetical protein
VQQALTARRRALVPMSALAAVLAVAVSSPAVAKTLVRYEKSGGIAGIQLTMTVTGAGGARITSTRMSEVTRFTLPAAQRRALARALRGARVSTLRSRYVASTPIADGFVQTVRYAGHDVTVQDGGRPPARLRSLLNRLGRLAARTR